MSEQLDFLPLPDNIPLARPFKCYALGYDAVLWECEMWATQPPEWVEITDPDEKREIVRKMANGEFHNPLEGLFDGYYEWLHSDLMPEGW